MRKWWSSWCERALRAAVGRLARAVADSLLRHGDAIQPYLTYLSLDHRISSKEKHTTTSQSSPVPYHHLDYLSQSGKHHIIPTAAAIGNTQTPEAYRSATQQPCTYRRTSSLNASTQFRQYGNPRIRYAAHEPAFPPSSQKLGPESRARLLRNLVVFPTHLCIWIDDMECLGRSQRQLLLGERLDRICEGCNGDTAIRFGRCELHDRSVHRPRVTFGSEDRCCWTEKRRWIRRIADL